MATKKENIANLQKRAEKATAPFSEKGLKRKKRISIVFVLGILVALGLGIISTSGERSRVYEEYLTDSSNIDFEYLRYEDTFTRWNENDIGNDVNVLLSGGKLYSKGNLSITPKEDSYDIIRDGQVIKSFDSNISYINVLSDTVIFRDDLTRKIYAYNMETNNEVVISNDNCGEVFAANGLIYYVSFTDGSSIASINLDGSGKCIVVDKPVANFLVCGDSIVYLTNTQYLYRHSLSSGSSTSIVSNVERFFVNGDLIIESDDLIFSSYTNGNKAEEVYRSSEPSMRLISATPDEIIYQENGVLYSISVDEGTSSEICSNEFELFTSVLRCSDTYLLIAYQDKPNAATAPKLVEVAAN